MRLLSGRIAAGGAAFRHSGFPFYFAALVCTGFAVQIQTVAIGWRVYDLTRDPLDLGLIGLSQFLPALLLVFVTGAVADRFPRRLILGISQTAMAAVAAGLLCLATSEAESVIPVFALMALFGTARAFYNPARQSIAANIVPPEDLSKAIATMSSANQIAMICGPVAGGLLYGLHPVAAFFAPICLFGVSAICVLMIPKPAQRIKRGVVNWESLSAGFSYIWREKIVLGAVSLDLFAVVLGGATALMPVFARDVLEIGPTGLGFLLAAPGIGAICVGMYLMVNPISDHAGRAMFAAVGLFGAFMIVFALSKTVWVSIAALIVIGGADMISVFVRGTLIQLWTPDELRGRVNAVNQVFIGASNEVGGFRAGVTAALIGPVGAVLIGGVGTLVVVGVWLRQFPQLSQIRHLSGKPAED